VGAAFCDGDATEVLIAHENSAAAWGPTAPHSWASGDRLTITVTYFV
jgi:hypothetical protein